MRRPSKGSATAAPSRLSSRGDPEGAGYCHCASCRSWSAGPVNAFTLWKPEAVKVTQGEDQIGEYNENERSYRQWCKACGGHLLTRHPQWGLVDVYAATIPEFPFAPGVHVNYESTVLPMKDGLPKLKDFPRSWAARARRSPSSNTTGRGFVGLQAGLVAAGPRSSRAYGVVASSRFGREAATSIQEASLPSSGTS